MLFPTTANLSDATSHPRPEVQESKLAVFARKSKRFSVVPRGNPIHSICVKSNKCTCPSPVNKNALHR